jgi:tripartite-type tricarboxylate transporter receptor subunit TctC
MRRALALILLACLCGPAWAQSAWPAKPVRLVLPFPPGGSVDFAGRLVAQHLQAALGQPVVIENRAGAGGSVGSEYVAQQPADGYTLIWGTISSHAINASLYQKIRYDNIKDFAPITLLMEQPLLVVVPVGSKLGSMADLLDALKKGESFNVGSPGVGTTGHLTSEFVKKRVGGNLTHVGYRGSGPMLTDLIGGHIDIGFENFPGAFPHVKSGKLRALAVTSEKRSPLAPDIPTLSEFVPGLTAVAWQALLAPAGTPDAVLARLEKEVVAVLDLPHVKAKLVELGNTPVGSSRTELAAFLKSETARWAELVEASGARADQ